MKQEGSKVYLTLILMQIMMHNVVTLGITSQSVGHILTSA